MGAEIPSGSVAGVVVAIPYSTLRSSSRNKQKRIVPSGHPTHITNITSACNNLVKSVKLQPFEILRLKVCDYSR